MIMRCCLLSIAIWLALVPGVASAQTPPTLSDYVVLALEGVVLRRDARVLGGAVGTVNGTVRVGRSARVTNVVAGPNIRLGADATVGNLFCHLLQGPAPLPACDQFTDPLVDPALLVPVAVAPGVDDVRLPPHTATAPVQPGLFRDVRV